MSTARRLLLPSLVVLSLSLPVAASAPTVAPPPSLDLVSPSVDARLTRAALSDAVPMMLPAPAAPVAPVRVTTPVAPAPAPRPVAPTPRPRTRPRADRGEFRPGWESRRGEIALSLISFPYKDLGWDISFHPARSGLLGLAHEPDKHIYIFVRKSQSPRSLAFTIAHEIGHAYDFTLGSAESHRRWRDLRGIDRSVPWMGCGDCSDLETPAGDFAEVFAVWQVGPTDFRSRIAPLPTGDQLDVLSREFRAIGSQAAA